MNATYKNCAVENDVATFSISVASISAVSSCVSVKSRSIQFVFCKICPPGSNFAWLPMQWTNWAPKSINSIDSDQLIGDVYFMVKLSTGHRIRPISTLNGQPSVKTNYFDRDANSAQRLGRRNGSGDGQTHRRTDGRLLFCIHILNSRILLEKF